MISIARTKGIPQPIARLLSILFFFIMIHGLLNLMSEAYFLTSLFYAAVVVAIIPDRREE